MHGFLWLKKPDGLGLLSIYCYLCFDSAMAACERCWPTERGAGSLQVSFPKTKNNQVSNLKSSLLLPRFSCSSRYLAFSPEVIASHWTRFCLFLHV